MGLREGQVMKKHILIVVALGIILLVYGCSRFHISSKEAQDIVKRDFSEHSEDFKIIADLLLAYTDRDISISDNKYDTSTDMTINNDIYQMEAGKNLSELGYDLITKPLEGGVYFYRFRQPFLGRGLMYYPNGFCPEYNHYNRIIMYLRGYKLE